MKNRMHELKKIIEVKHLLLPLLMLGFSLNAFSQIPLGQKPIPDGLPTVVPPSPTVAALMKFEEVSVNTYNGVPDINIPIYNANSKGGLNLDVKLGYHPSNINANLAASDCGLGWSLFAGGTISRTVKGLPDEIYIPGNKMGIYRTVLESGNNINRFYQISGYMDDGTHFSPTNQQTTFDYMWDVMVGGKLDTEHDLYQYNFMGYSGRFIIQKNASGALQIVKLDKNPLKIVNFYDAATFAPTSFEITDDKGAKYRFDVIETTTTSTLIHSEAPYGPFEGYGGTTTNGTTGVTYRSAFHLSKVYDSANVLSIELSYTNDDKKEMVASRSNTFAKENTNQMSTLANNLYYQLLLPEFNPLPAALSITSQQTTLIRKLSRIKVIGQSRLHFTYTTGRPDSNLLGAANAYKLSGISVRTWKDSVQEKRFEFVYGVSQKIDSRMMLSVVNIYDRSNAFAYKYELYYKNSNYEPALLGKDFWGYINQKPGYLSNLKYQETTPQHCTNDALELMKIPTGGAIRFNFESNTYSHIGNAALTNFDDNVDNWKHETATKNFTTVSNNTTAFFTILPFDDQVVYFQASAHFTGTATDWRFRIYKIENGVNVDVGALWNQTSRSMALVPGDYMVSFDTPGVLLHNNPLSASITVFYKRKLLGTIWDPVQVKKYLYGGGIRIKNIQYYKDFDLNMINDPNVLPEKQTNYSYNFFTDSFHSSGSLVYPKPVFKYTKQKRECMRAYAGIGVINSSDNIILTYDMTTTTDNLSVIKTKGSEVGYKNVTVTETGNGRREMEYTSAIDHPEVITTFNTQYPFLPTENIDYKRGNLLSSRTFDQQGRKLEETVNTYDYLTDSGTINTGIRFYYPGDYQFINYFGHTSRSAYLAYLAECFSRSDCFCTFGEPYTFITFARTSESFGTANLATSISRQFFYDGSSTVALPALQSSSTFTYDATNKKLKRQEVTDPSGDTTVTEYYYAQNMPGAPNAGAMVSKNMVSQPLRTVTTRNGEKLSEQNSVYRNWGNGLLAPETIQSSKGAGALETRVRYVNVDTSTGNVLEVQQEGGTSTSYIWGYNRTVPVAKIENMSYAVIPAALIAAIETASNSSSTGLEANLLTALGNLRGDASLSGALVTTFTYAPLSGVRTVTDPKGHRTTYDYDNSGRLASVKDHNGNLLGQNSYNYRP